MAHIMPSAAQITDLKQMPANQCRACNNRRGNKTLPGFFR